MLKNGTYSVWFRTAGGEGTGQVQLENGIVTGRDSFISYAGTYKVEGSRFSAIVTTKRYMAGAASLFGPGIDEVELHLTGVARGDIASCSGTVAGGPDMTLEVTMIFSDQRPIVSNAHTPRVVPGASRLPKLPTLRR